MARNTDASPYEQGYAAGLDGLTVDDNPYDDDPDASEEWLDGYRDGIRES